jgi:hypothetical protein
VKIVLSRKGFDSSAGGCASPTVNGRPLSLPIPTHMPSPTRYRDLSGDTAGLVGDLSRGKIQAGDFCHLDPDLDSDALPRRRGWRGSLGQAAAAQGHLHKQQVGPGDLFLFWGLYRPAERRDHWCYTGHKEHRIFGWLQIDSVVQVGENPSPVLERYPWLVDHPHLQPGWPTSNTVYVAKKKLQLEDSQLDLPGWGLFPSGYRLTETGNKLPSRWLVPDWMNPKRGGVGMSYHPEQRWTDTGRLTAAARGQEFVAHVGKRADALRWTVNLFKQVQ